MPYRSITVNEIPIVADIQSRAFRFPAERYLEAYNGSGRVDHTALRLLENEKGQPVAALNVFTRPVSLNGDAVDAGLLSPKQFGPPVHPPAPRLGLTAAFSGGLDRTTSEGEDRYRRAIYTHWQRSSPYPSLETFDMSNREVCDLRRIHTNTPLQALVTLNDEVYVEAAQALARRMTSEYQDPEAIAKAGFRHVLIRHPTTEEVAVLVDLYRESLQHFSDAPDDARSLIGAGDQTKEDTANGDQGQSIATDEIIRLAAWTTVANVLLNLDEVFQKR